MVAANTLPARGEELMRIVMRFEYSLKETRYGRSINGSAEADWDKFANETLKAEFYDCIRKNGVAPTLLTEPPSKQVLQSGILSWVKCSKLTDVQSLIGAVRRVRNNLVHGGKSGDPDSDRNDAMVSEAIEILLASLRASDDVRFAFENLH
jgi:hypothetical protein